MAAIRPRDLLSDGLLERLGQAKRESLAADVASLADVGYLNVALPPEFGGLGCTLRQAACGQRRLARHAPDTALAVSAHLYWTGAAADAHRAGDDSVRWILVEAARGALFAGGHEAPGGDLRLADPRSRCERSGEGGYEFRDRRALSTVTPGWDWIALHGVHAGTRGLPGEGAEVRPQSVIAFAGRGARCTPALRVARVSPAGTPADVFTTGALTWGHSILASVQYSDARRAFNDAITSCAAAATPAAFASGSPAPPASTAPANTDPTNTVPANTVPANTVPAPAGAAHASEAGATAAGGRSPSRWPAAEANALLDAMKAKIAEITHPWQLVQIPAPDLGGQHLISLYAMRHEIAEGAATVHALVNELAGATTPARPLPL